MLPDQSLRLELEYRVSHRHRDGSWAEMEEAPSHHDPAQHDQERLWSSRRIFRCRSCAESVAIVPGEEGGVPER